MKEELVYILIRGRNAEPFLWKCLESALSQTYSNFQILFVDDASEYSRQTRNKVTQLLDGHTLVWNTSRRFSLYNAVNPIKKYCTKPHSIVISLDADDWFARPDAVELIVQGYQKTGAAIGYGDCFIFKNNSYEVASKVTIHNHPYPAEVKKRLAYRDHPCLPMHPRSWRVSAFNSIPDEAFCRSDGSWLEYAEDLAIFLPLLEMYGDHCFISPLPLSVYNAANSKGDVITNTLPLLKDELEIRRKKSYEPKVY